MWDAAAVRHAGGGLRRAVAVLRQAPAADGPLGLRRISNLIFWGGHNDMARFSYAADICWR